MQRWIAEADAIISIFRLACGNILTLRSRHLVKRVWMTGIQLGKILLWSPMISYVKIPLLTAGQGVSGTWRMSSMTLHSHRLSQFLLHNLNQNEPDMWANTDWPFRSRIEGPKPVSARAAPQFLEDFGILLTKIRGTFPENYRKLTSAQPNPK